MLHQHSSVWLRHEHCDIPVARAPGSSCLADGQTRMFLDEIVLYRVVVVAWP